MPNFRLNLFIQAKRPMVFKRAPRHIYAAGLNPPGWCFGIEPHQQEALERVAARIGRRAAILYAAPAFHTVTQLFGHVRAGTVVDNSTFPDVLRLRGHSKWYYNQAGGNGVANPDAEPSEGPTLDETIEKLRFDAQGRRTPMRQQILLSFPTRFSLRSTTMKISRIIRGSHYCSRS